MGVRHDVWDIYRQALPVLFVALGGGLFAGLVLELVLEHTVTFPGLLIMIPAFLATRGSVYGALGGRIASGLHQGLIEPRFERDDRLFNAVVASFVNGIGISVVIAISSWLALIALGWPRADLLHLVGIMLIAGLLTSMVMIVGLLGLIFYGFRQGYDPDNLVGPIVTTLGDIFGMCFLLFSVVLMEGLVG